MSVAMRRRCDGIDGCSSLPKAAQIGARSSFSAITDARFRGFAMRPPHRHRHAPFLRPEMLPGSSRLNQLPSAAGRSDRIYLDKNIRAGQSPALRTILAVLKGLHSDQADVLALLNKCRT